MTPPQTKTNLAFNSFVTPGLAYVATALFVTIILHVRAHVGTFFLITLLWLFAWMPLIATTGGNLALMVQLLGQPRSFFESYVGKYAQPTEYQYGTAFNVYSVFVTALIFSIYVPLDSETILQEWPVAPVTGACLGLLIGAMNMGYNVMQIRSNDAQL